MSSTHPLPSKTTDRPRTRARNRFRPAVDGLEDRIALAADNNDTRGTAINLGSLSSTFSRSGDVGSAGDNQDFYKFTLGATDGVRVRLSGLTADLDVELQNSSGGAITSSRNGGSANDEVSRTIAPGTYYIRVYKGTSSAITRYSLRFDRLFTGDPEGNDSRSSAVNLGALSGSRVRTGTIGLPSSDTQDFYRFTASAGRTLRYTLDRLERDLDIEILNSSGQVISSSRNGGTTVDTKAITLLGGTYYARVYRVGTNVSNYRLTLNLA